ncbi:MAG TPA: CocE/NonD family hydrolase, partial [Ilumatobacteraceae bacterium]|nr:CocE/NonD family hydrolase [Ilumatobacteraceae bacterium]
MATRPADVVLTRDIGVPMRDGVVLRGDLYLPVGDGPFPCLLQRTPYVKDYNPGIWVVCDPLKAAGAGFAVFIQDVRGRGISDGEFTPFIDEAADGVDTIDWVSRQTWCDGRVAMHGSSYMAAAQWQAAKERPAAFQASCDYYEGRSYRGGAFEIGALLGVSLNALGGGIAHRKIQRGELPKSAAREARTAVDQLVQLARTPLAELRKTVLNDIAPFFFDWAERTDPGHEYWRELDLTGRHQDIHIPVFHLSSWFDQA